MVFNTLNKTFSLQNLCAEFCCFSLGWSAASFHTLQWSWSKQLTQLENKHAFPLPAGLQGKRQCQGATVTAGLRNGGARCARHPARPWALRSGHPRAPTCPVLSSQDGAGSKLPALAARTCSSSDITRALNALRPWRGPISCCTIQLDFYPISRYHLTSAAFFLHEQGTNEDRMLTWQWCLQGLMQPLQKGAVVQHLCSDEKDGWRWESREFISTWPLRGSISTGSGDWAKLEHLQLGNLLKSERLAGSLHSKVCVFPDMRWKKSTAVLSWDKTAKKTSKCILGRAVVGTVKMEFHLLHCICKWVAGGADPGFWCFKPLILQQVPLLLRLTLMLQACQASLWELDYGGRWGCPMPWSTSLPALWWGGQQNTSHSWTWDCVCPWHLLEIFTITLSESLKRPFGQTKTSTTHTFLKGPILWDSFSRLLAVSPLQFLLVYVHLISNQTKLDNFNINSTTLLMTTKYWLKWLIHLIMLRKVCANKKMQ